MKLTAQFFAAGETGQVTDEKRGGRLTCEPATFSESGHIRTAIFGIVQAGETARGRLGGALKVKHLAELSSLPKPAIVAFLRS